MLECCLPSHGATSQLGGVHLSSTHANSIALTTRFPGGEHTVTVDDKVAIALDKAMPDWRWVCLFSLAVCGGGGRFTRCWRPLLMLVCRVQVETRPHV